MRAAEADRIRTYAVDQGLETIRNRIDQFGVAETTVVKQGTNRILVELPGVSDQARARQLIGKTALLEFKLIDETNSLEEALKGIVPPGSQVLYQQETDPATGRDEPHALPGPEAGDPHRRRPQRRPGRSLRLLRQGPGRLDELQQPRRAHLRAGHRGERRQAPGDRARRQRLLGAGHPGEDHRRARPDQRAVHGRGGHRPGDRAARRQPARAGRDPRGALGRPVARLGPGEEGRPRDARRRRWSC